LEWEVGGRVASPTWGAAMKACECCQRSLPDDSAPQRRYCGRADCKRGRDAYRKAHQRAGAYNALTCVVSPLPERPKRKTSSTHNPAGDHEDDLNFDSGEITSRWDEISRAWQAANVWRPTVDLPANRGLPALDERGRRIGKLIDLDRLMGEAERAVRPLHRSAGTPVGQLHEANWSREDWNSPGELWLRGETDRAVEKAKKEAEHAFNRTERGPR
jgi:hypothetical protein